VRVGAVADNTAANASWLGVEMIYMALIKLLVAPIRRVVNFPLFQLTVAIAVIVLLQAADSRSVFGKIFSALDLLVDLTVRLCAATFEVKSFTKSWLTTGFMIAYVYIAGLLEPISKLLRAVDPL
jgi:hypothetical protein